jgi:glycosyltransferase involved in cell wall biosynthesis
MNDRSILYLGTIVTDAVKEEYGFSYHSRAANSKKRNIIHSLESQDADVTVVSPVFVNNNSFRYFSGRTMYDEETDTELHVPAFVDIYGLNYLVLFLTTTLLTLRLLFRGSFDATIFYDFKIETAIPSVAGKLLTGTPSIVEYDDGLFLHDNTVIRWSAKALLPVCGRFVDGAFCVNQPLADLLATDNTEIVRGFPSIGMPDDLPDPVYERDEVVVMFSGRFDHVRGINPFLEVTPRLPFDDDEIQIWVSGYGSEDEIERVKRAVEDCGDERFTFFGTAPWEEYRKRVVSADVMVNFQNPDDPISEYTFPSKMLDYMSAGKPIVSTNMSDLGTHFDDKLIIAGTSNDDLYDGLVETVEAVRDGRDLSVDGRAQQWIRDECSKSAVGQKLLGLVRTANE